MSFIVPYHPGWHQKFLDEANLINKSTEGIDIRLHHIGSTAIPDIFAKPIIDILGEVDDFSKIDRLTSKLHKIGYDAKGEQGIEGRQFFQKFSPNGERSHHLHIYVKSSEQINRHLAFRDYLIANWEVAKQYSNLKISLTSGGFTRETYIAGKDPFIRKIEADALNWYQQERHD